MQYYEPLYQNAVAISRRPFSEIVISYVTYLSSLRPEGPGNMEESLLSLAANLLLGGAERKIIGIGTASLLLEEVNAVDLAGRLSMLKSYRIPKKGAWLEIEGLLPDRRIGVLASPSVIDGSDVVQVVVFFATEGQGVGIMDVGAVIVPAKLVCPRRTTRKQWEDYKHRVAVRASRTHSREDQRYIVELAERIIVSQLGGPQGAGVQQGATDEIQSLIYVLLELNDFDVRGCLVTEKFGCSTKVMGIRKSIAVA